MCEGGNTGGGDSVSHGSEDEEHPERNFRHAGGIVNSSVNEYLPRRDHPIPRLVEGPNEPYSQSSGTDSDDDELPNFSLRQHSSIGSAQAPWPTPTQSFHCHRQSASLEDLKPTERASQLNQSITKPSQLYSMARYSESDETRNTLMSHLSTAESQEEWYDVPEVDPKHFPAQALLPQISILSTLSHDTEDLPPPSVPQAVHRKTMSDFALRPASTPSSSNQAQPGEPTPSLLHSRLQKLYEWSDKKKKSERESLGIEPEKSQPLSTFERFQKRPRPSSMKIESKPCYDREISDGPDVEEIGHYVPLEEKPIKPDSHFQFIPEPCHEDKAELPEGSTLDEPCPSVVNFTSNLTQRAIRQRYKGIQPRYTEMSQFWLKSCCQNKMKGKGAPCCEYQWPPNGKVEPRTDFLLNNALRVVREPAKVPIPKFVDQKGKVSNWCMSGMARNYIYKPDFGKVPSYLRPTPVPMSRQDRRQFQHIMSLCRCG